MSGSVLEPLLASFTFSLAYAEVHPNYYLLVNAPCFFYLWTFNIYRTKRVKLEQRVNLEGAGQYIIYILERAFIYTYVCVHAHSLSHV